MALPDLTGQNIQDTYQRVLQTDNGALRDGTGSLVDELTIPGTGSFGRVICTTISASSGDFDANTIRIGGTPFSKIDLDTLKEGKSIRTTAKDLKEGDDPSTDVITTKGIFSTSDDDTLIKFGNNIMGCIVSGSPFFTIQKNDSTNRVTIGNGTTDLQLKGNINEATLDGGTF
tara:strand:- start:27 stop:545 length:519 start_codon:yes stop_codon:yes gene_type:complete